MRKCAQYLVIAVTFPFVVFGVIVQIVWEGIASGMELADEYFTDLMED